MGTHSEYELQKYHTKKNDDYQLGIPFKKRHSSIIQVGLSCDKKNDSDNSQSVIAL